MIDFILHVLALAGGCSDQNYRNARAVELIVDPFLDSGIALTLNLFKISLVDETHLLIRGDDVAVTHVHRALHILVLKAEKYLSCHGYLP
ncbi:hypothetical protein D3C77_639140 [compost metagenome]